MPHPLAMLFLIAAMTMTGANVPFGKAIISEIPIDVFLLVRFAFASLVLAVLVRFEDGPELRTLTPGQWRSVAVLGIVGSVLFTWFLLEGVKRTPAANAGVITGALPAVIAVFGVGLGERMRRGEIGMVALAFVGVLIIQLQAEAPSVSGSTHAFSLAGNLLVCLAVVCEAAFVAVAKGISATVRPIRLSLGVALVSLAACVPFTLGAALAFEWSRVGLGTWMLFAWHALAASVLCTVLWYKGAPHVATWAAGLATAVLPLSALLVSSFYLGEAIGGLQIVGAALVVGAIVLGTLAGRTTPMSRLR